MKTKEEIITKIEELDMAKLCEDGIITGMMTQAQIEILEWVIEDDTQRNNKNIK